MHDVNDQPLAVLGGLSANEFLRDYWQKKPLLVRNAMPNVVGFIDPDDLQQLATTDGVTARLLSQQGKDADQWQLKHSPLTEKDFKRLPLNWTLLVQAVDHWSVDVAEWWRAFDFLPQWRRDDIMMSYAPRGGSVGQHFDQYDVFLVQTLGHRRWQLGQSFGADADFVPKQPLRLLSDMGEIVFDEVLAAGDLLYVPPSLSHYGVAQDHCITASFGFRMPSTSGLLDRLTDHLLNDGNLQLPINDRAVRGISAAGQVSADDLAALRERLYALLNDPEAFEAATIGLLSEPKYPDSLQEHDEDGDILTEWLALDGVQARLEPTSRLLYVQDDAGTRFWANGEALDIPLGAETLMQSLADGVWLSADQLAQLPIDWLTELHQNGLLLWDLPEDDDDA